MNLTPFLGTKYDPLSAATLNIPEAIIEMVRSGALSSWAVPRVLRFLRAVALKEFDQVMKMRVEGTIREIESV